MPESFYIVKPGDSLSKIAKELWGDAKRWPEIFEANRDHIKDPNLIHVGQQLRIPGATAAPAAPAPAAYNALPTSPPAAPAPAAYNVLPTSPPATAAEDTGQEKPPAPMGKHGGQQD